MIMTSGGARRSCRSAWLHSFEMAVSHQMNVKLDKGIKKQSTINPRVSLLARLTLAY